MPVLPSPLPTSVPGVFTYTPLLAIHPSSAYGVSIVCRHCARSLPPWDLSSSEGETLHNQLHITMAIVMTAMNSECRVQCKWLNGGHQARAGDLGCTQNPSAAMQLCLPGLGILVPVLRAPGSDWLAGLPWVLRSQHHTGPSSFGELLPPFPTACLWGCLFCGSRCPVNRSLL